jgi:cytidylate kinase
VPDEKTAEELTLEREQSEVGLYQFYHSIDIDDLLIYRSIFNSAHLRVEGLGAIVDTTITHLMLLEKS